MDAPPVSSPNFPQELPQEIPDPTRDIARTILSGFDKHYRIFRESSAAARELFEKKQWAELREINRSRIDMYDTRVLESVEKVSRQFPNIADDTLWPKIKKEYIALLYEHRQPELAETFFNSVAAKLLYRKYHNNQYIFTRPAVAAEHIEGAQPTYRCYYPMKTGLRKALDQIFSDFGLCLKLTQPRRCMRNLICSFRAQFPRERRQQGPQGSQQAKAQPFKLEPNFHIQVLSSLFYRHKAAYVVGRIINGSRRELFAIALRHDPSHSEFTKNDKGGLYIDAWVREREHLANLFSVAHAYFMVDMEVPSSWISFIHDALPEKPKAELYTAVGLQKQGKTLFFRDLNHHLKHSADTFVVAPGVRGMVMLVFTLPSFPFVFKVIRDSFEAPKDTSRELVMEKYRLVKMHDRVGRMADTLEYAHVAFPANRFDPDLLSEMRRLIPSNFEIDGEHLLIRHLYIEQRMKPLDIFLREADLSGDQKLMRHGVREFGQALRDLAAANIFPGDLLPKNFGVSPYGRVLFYDYDEVCYLTECNFREMHDPRHFEDEMRAEPWYTVAPNDVFPEEFSKFLFAQDGARELFREMHGDLLKPRFWSQTQANIRAGKEDDLYPYPQELRLQA